MMFEAELTPVISSLCSSFGKVHDLHDNVEIFEHQNELLLFGGIDEISYKDTVSESSGGFYTLCEASYLVSLYGKRSVSAKALCDIFDSKVLPALKSCAAKIKSLRRLPCRFSKEHGGYIVSAELIFSAYVSGIGSYSSVEFSIGGKSYYCMKSYEIKSAVKTAETPLLSGVIRSRKIGIRPDRLTVKGEIIHGASTIYSSLKPLIGTAVSPLGVGGNDFSGMMMSDLSLTGRIDGIDEIVVEFSKVDEI